MKINVFALSFCFAPILISFVGLSWFRKFLFPPPIVQICIKFSAVKRLCPQPFWSIVNTHATKQPQHGCLTEVKIWSATIFSPNGNFVAPILQSKGFSSAWHDQYSSNVMQCTEVSVPINICAFQPSVLVTVSFGNFPLPIQSYGEHMCTLGAEGRENQKSAMSLSCNVRMCLFRGNWFLHLPRVRAPVRSASSQKSWWRISLNQLINNYCITRQ